MFMPKGLVQVPGKISILGSYALSDAMRRKAIEKA
jgi:hypothetical protein